MESQLKNQNNLVIYTHRFGIDEELKLMSGEVEGWQKLLQVAGQGSFLMSCGKEILSP